MNSNLKSKINGMFKPSTDMVKTTQSDIEIEKINDVYNLALSDVLEILKDIEFKKEVREMKNKFKTFVVGDKEFGIIDITGESPRYRISFYTSSKPQLFVEDTSVEDIIKYYSTLCKIDYDKLNIPSNWVFREIELNLI